MAKADEWLNCNSDFSNDSVENNPHNLRYFTSIQRKQGKAIPISKQVIKLKQKIARKHLQEGRRLILPEINSNNPSISPRNKSECIELPSKSILFTLKFPNFFYIVETPWKIKKRTLEKLNNNKHKEIVIWLPQTNRIDNTRNLREKLKGFDKLSINKSWNIGNGSQARK